jgi:hypothetical protein
MFPVYIYEDGMSLPNEGTYFVVAGNGSFLRKDTGIVSGLVSVANISSLPDLHVASNIQCRLPKIPAKYIYQVQQFFADVIVKYQAEACVLLFYNKTTGEFKVMPSPQGVSGAGVHYKFLRVTTMENMEGFLRVGTIHSHNNFAAFHSGTDIDDESDFDGLHCTFGNNDREVFSITASVVMNNQRVKVDPLDVLGGLEFVPQSSHPFGGYHVIAHDESWLEETKHWIEEVTSAVRGWKLFGGISNKPVSVKLTWADGLNVMRWKAMFGEGPFAYEDGGDKVKINLPDCAGGWIAFPKSMFKECKE